MLTTYTTTSTTHLTYELHTFIFPSSKPARASIPQYFFPISTSLADEFLQPHPSSLKPTSTPTPGPECWPYHLLPHPEWVVATILRFTDKMRDSSWNVAGMKFVDEEEEERERERVRWEMEERRIREQKRGGGVHFYGGVYYGGWYGEGKEGSGKTKGGGGYMGGIKAGSRTKGELKCQILMVREV
ncbi:hypothetical protein L211DRAFT_845034 [Terfezia boudieri ATCC MYA-4762]|uniref:Uncharacterized protein n=1 Tax=Terfezia boudieri ATCC MYA-4762 TaxID=1051890 RepID=A0A3N4M5B5_9PEZI|nr:hypothetical protein L211DRAFT_845034 [Terfezia boudieri ATCC MYA-4762]